jgi:hypothetical protein
VRVVAAAELIAADRNGSSDPYVLVQLAGGSTSVGSVLAGGLGDVRGALGELQGDIAQASQRARQGLEAGLDSMAAAIRPKERPQLPLESVDRPTPEGLWFTPRAGWPVSPLGRTLSRPEALTTTAAAAAAATATAAAAAAATTASTATARRSTTSPQLLRTAAAPAAATTVPSARPPPPPLLMPTASEAAALHAREEATLGELRVEVISSQPFAAPSS